MKPQRYALTTLRTLDELRAVVEANPFPEHEDEPKHPCVTFLSHAPTKGDREAAAARRGDHAQLDHRDEAQ